MPDAGPSSRATRPEPQDRSRTQSVSSQTPRAQRPTGWVGSRRTCPASAGTSSWQRRSRAREGSWREPAPICRMRSRGFPEGSTRWLRAGDASRWRPCRDSRATWPMPRPRRGPPSPSSAPRRPRCSSARSPTRVSRPRSRSTISHAGSIPRSRSCAAFPDSPEPAPHDGTCSSPPTRRSFAGPAACGARTRS